MGRWWRVPQSMSSQVKFAAEMNDAPVIPTCQPVIPTQTFSYCFQKHFRQKGSRRGDGAAAKIPLMLQLSHTLLERWNKTDVRRPTLEPTGQLMREQSVAELLAEG